MNSPLDVRSSRTGDTLILEVVGEIDMATAPDLASAIEAVEDGIGRVVVDLSGVGFLDSSGLSALVQGERGLAERTIALRVVSPSNRAVHKVFEITRLIGPLSVVESLDDALA